MGCFTVLKFKKKRIDPIAYTKCLSHNEHVPAAHTCLLQSAPPSFRIRVKSIHPINKVTNNRTRTLSAPPVLDVTKQNALITVEFEEREESRYRVGLMKEQHSSSPQPLPLPSCQGCGSVKVTGSFKSGIASGPLYASGPAPDTTQQDASASVEYDEEKLKHRVGLMKEQCSSNPQPLPLPSRQGGGGALKANGSFKSGISSGPLYASEPAPDATEQDALASVEYEEQEELKHRVGLMKEQCSSNPQPLPLPSRQSGGSALKANVSFKSGMASAPLYVSGPLPLPPTGLLRNFLFEEIAAACHNFSSDRCMSECFSSTIYSASFGDDASSAKKFEATVTHLRSSTQGLKEFINDVNTLASLQHPNLCKLLGFHVQDGSEPRMLVYERLSHGSLNHLLFGRSDGASIDWNSRMKIAICAAQGLAFLHEEGPFQAMYNEFSTVNIQVDKDFSAKLSGYGCVGRIPENEISSSSFAVGNLSVETLERGIVTPKSSVWGFGIILLELLTGRKNLDSHHPKEERNLVKWSRPYLADDFRLSLIMDPQLKGHFPPKAARTVADIAQRCLQKEPSERPTIRTIVEQLKMVQDMKYSCWFPLQEPAAMSSKQISRSPSLNGIICHAPRLSFSPSAPSVARPSFSPPRWSGVSILHLPLRACSSTSSMEELGRPESRNSSSSMCRRDSVEGY